MPYTVNRASIFSFCLLLSLSYIKTKVHFNSLLFTLHFLLLQQHISLTLTFSLYLSFSLTMTLDLTLSLVDSFRTFVHLLLQLHISLTLTLFSFSIFSFNSDYDFISDSISGVQTSYIYYNICTRLPFSFASAFFDSDSDFDSFSISLSFFFSDYDSFSDSGEQCAHIFEHSCHNVTFFSIYVDKL